MWTGKKQYRPCLPLEPWFEERLTAVGDDAVVPRALRLAGGGSRDRGDMLVHGMIRLGCESSAKHRDSWRTVWNPEEQLQFDFHDQPSDAYSFDTIDVCHCLHGEVMHHRFGREQTQRLKRLYSDNHHLDARISGIKPNLFIGNWNSFAGDVRMTSTFNFQWSFERRACLSGADPGTNEIDMLSDSSCGASSDRLQALSPSSESDFEDMSADGVLHRWGLGSLDPNFLPILVVPEPLAFLVLKKE